MLSKNENPPKASSKNTLTTAMTAAGCPVPDIQGMIDFFPDPTLIVSRNKEVIVWNRALEEMTGVCKENVLGKGDYAHAIPFYGKKKPLLLDLLLSDGQALEHNFKQLEKSGDTICAKSFVPLPFKEKGAFIWGKASPLFDQHGNLIGAVECFRVLPQHRQAEYKSNKRHAQLKKLVNERTKELQAVNERLQQQIANRMFIEGSLRESEKKYRILYEQANDAILLLQGTTIIDCNLKALHLFACEQSTIIGQNIYNFSPSVQPCGTKSRKKAIEQIKALPAGTPYSFEWLFQRPDGTSLMTEVSLSKFKLQDHVILQAVIHDLTEHKQAKEMLRSSKEQYRQIVETAYEGIWTIDAENRTTFVNQRMAEMLGYAIDEMIGQPLSAFLYEEDKAMADASNMKELLASKQHLQYDLRYRRKDSTQLFTIASVSPLLNQDGSYAGALGMVTDITERKLIERELQKTNEKLGELNEELIAINEELLVTEEELKRQIKKLQESENALASTNQLLQDIIEFLPDATLVINRDRKVIAWNKAIEKMTGVPKEEMLGKNNYAYAIPFYGEPIPILIDVAFEADEQQKEFYESFKKEDNYVHGTTFIPQVHGGKGAYCWGISSPLYDREGNLAGAIESIRDITEQKELEERLKHLSLHDTLTGLHNRAYFEEEMRRLENGRTVSVGIIVCDVDGLKLVNDTLGHETGDMLLKAAGSVIKESFRESDMVARIGGDEFAVLLPRSTRKALENACKRTQYAVSKHNTANPALPLSISIGFAIRNDTSMKMSDLFKEADNMMYREKLHRKQSARSAITQALIKTLEARQNRHPGQHAL